MATPIVQTRSTGATSAADTATHSITMPSGITAGDLLVVVFSTDEAPTCTASSGWFKLGQASSTTVVTGAIFYKIAVGSDTCTITTSTNQQSSHVAFRISGAGFPTGTSANGDSTNSDPPSHAPGYSSDFLWIATRSGDSTEVASAAPASYSNLQTQAAAGTSGASTNTAERAVTASSEDPGTFTSNTEQWVSYTLAIPPVLPSTGSLTDNYNDNSTDTAKWNDFIESTQTIVETNQHLEITTALIAGTGQRLSDNSYSLVGSYISQKLVAGGTSGDPVFILPAYGFETESEGRAVFWVIGDGNSMSARYRDASYAETTLFGDVYTPATHVYFRVREAAGTIYWDWSTDGSSWTNAASELASVVNVGVTRLTIGMQAGFYASNPTSDTVIFDDFNLSGSATTTTSTSSTSSSTSSTSTSSTSTSSTSTSSTSSSTSSTSTSSTSTSSTSTSSTSSSTSSTSTSVSTSSTSTSTSTLPFPNARAKGRLTVQPYTPSFTIAPQASTDNILSSCPAVLTNDPDYLANDSRACAGSGISASTVQVAVR